MSPEESAHSLVFDPARHLVRLVLLTFTATTDTAPLTRITGSTWPIVPTVSGVAAQELPAWHCRRQRSAHILCSGGLPERSQRLYGHLRDRPLQPGNYPYLQETIDYFKGFLPPEPGGPRRDERPDRLDAAVGRQRRLPLGRIAGGLRAALLKPSIRSSTWAPTGCRAPGRDLREYLRQVVDLIIANGTLPVLSTKVDNVEGNHGINKVTAQIAHDYDLP